MPDLEYRDPLQQPYNPQEWNSILGIYTGDRVAAVLKPLEKGFPRLRPSFAGLIDALETAVAAVSATDTNESILVRDLWIANPEQTEIEMMVRTLATKEPQAPRLSERMGDGTLDQILFPMVEREVEATENGRAIQGGIVSRIEMMVDWPAMARESDYKGYLHPVDSVIIRIVKKLITYQATLEALGRQDRASLITPFVNLCMQGNFPVGVINGRFLVLTADEYKPAPRVEGGVAREQITEGK